MNDAQRQAGPAAPFATPPEPEQARRDRSEPLSRSHFGFQEPARTKAQGRSQSE